MLPVLEEELGPGVAAALARTADLLRADADALDDLAPTAYEELRADPETTGAGLALAGLLAARRRSAAGCCAWLPLSGRVRRAG